MTGKPGERGAALIAVLAMVTLLAGFTTLGLSRLRAAGDQISDAEARAEAQLVANSGVNAALSVANRLKARSRMDRHLLSRPIRLEMGESLVEARLADGGNCFNLNSLAREIANASEGALPDSQPADLSRLLVATGIPRMDADAIAGATAGRLASTGQMWADASEIRLIPGMTPPYWALSRKLLCALPTREASTFNVNNLTPDQAPLLAGAGLSVDQARQAIARRPAGGWQSAGNFLESAAPGGTGDGADMLGISSRWMTLWVRATTPRATVMREVLIDTLRQPARVVSSRWHAVEVRS